jgi:hypothetical protein
LSFPFFIVGLSFVVWGSNARVPARFPRRWDFPISLAR